MFPLTAYFIAAHCFALDPDPQQSLRVLYVQSIMAESNRYESHGQPTPADLERNAQYKQAGDVVRDWEAGGDPAQAIGTLRTLLAEDPSLSAIQVHLARILQSEGRIQEAADVYWVICHRPTRNGSSNPHYGNIGMMVRIADALEDAGRTEDAAWAFLQTGEPNRRAAYRTYVITQSNPYWACKFMRKLLRDDPKDAEAKRWLGYSEAQITNQNAKGQKPWTRDIPRE